MFKTVIFVLECVQIHLKQLLLFCHAIGNSSRSNFFRKLKSVPFFNILDKYKAPNFTSHLANGPCKFPRKINFLEVLLGKLSNITDCMSQPAIHPYNSSLRAKLFSHSIGMTWTDLTIAGLGTTWRVIALSSTLPINCWRKVKICLSRNVC